MTTQRHGTGNPLAKHAQPTSAGKLLARNFPIQREIQELERELHAFNERIAELKDEGHNSHAIGVLKANAMDFARRIDELRCVLVEQTKKR